LTVGYIRMTLTPEIEAKGLKAYEQARAFERLRAWRLPLSYVIFQVIPLLSGVMAWQVGRTLMGAMNFAAAADLPWFRGCTGVAAGRYGITRSCCRDGEDLWGAVAWVQVEKHFAELEKLERELAEERRGNKEPRRKQRY